MKLGLPISPSLTTSRPASTCCHTLSVTAVDHGAIKLAVAGIIFRRHRRHDLVGRGLGEPSERRTDRVDEGLRRLGIALDEPRVGIERRGGKRTPVKIVQVFLLPRVEN